MNARTRKTLAAIFAKPVRQDIRWRDIEAVIRGLGGIVSEREGSRVAFELNDRRAVFHRPHPKPETDRNTVRDVRDFLESAGIKT